MTDHTETIGRELVALIRGSKELQHLVAADRGYPAVEPSAYVLLSRISEQGPIRPSVLAGCLFLDLSTISRQLQDLEQAGWIGRDRDPLDGRASLVRLTPAGAAVVQAAYEQRTSLLRRLLSSWTEDERHLLATQFSRFNEAIAAFRTSAALSSPIHMTDVQETA